MWINGNFEESFEYTGDYQEYIVPQDGVYKIELWGASSGNLDKCTWSGCNGATVYRSYGSYTSGDIKLKKNDILYFYVGKIGYASFDGGKVAFNGGGSFSNNYSYL